MFRKFTISLHILTACTGVINSFSQQFQNADKPEQYRAINWTKDDGLPIDIANVMFRDAKGFLWIGSSAGGFCRFDGTNFKRYYPDQEKKGTINSDAIWSFKEDSLHNIWMGTDKGLSRYDMKADTFTNFSPFIDSAFSKRTTFSELTVAPFWATKDEMYCLELGGAITAINIYTLKREKILQLSTTNLPAIGWKTNKSFFDKSSKSFWFLYGDARLGQIFLDGRTQFYAWPYYEDKTSNGHRRHDSEDMCYDPNRNSVWINSGEDCLNFL